MSEPKNFVAGLNSDARKSPVRVAFITRRTSPQVRVADENRVMTYPEAFFRAIVAIEVLAMFLVWLAMMWDAPLEQLADPMHTPNPAKAPWYFLGLQELLHYFPPVVAGVLIPTLVVLALVVIPYFNINIEAEGLWVRDRTRKLRIFATIAVTLIVFLAVFHVWVAVGPTVLVAVAMLVSARSSVTAQTQKAGWRADRPLSFWIMTWFLFELVVLTAVGTFFRGPGWSWVWPW
jgi:quinol---cytochrome c reductase cytochrome c subunit, bacillus type